MGGMVTKQVDFLEGKDIQGLYGIHDESLKVLEKAFSVRITAREHHLAIHGSQSQVEQVESLLGQLGQILDKGHPLQKNDLHFFIKLAAEGRQDEIPSILSERIEVPSRGRYVTPKGPGQRDYIQAIRQYDMVFGIGPAGTGKTYLAMAMAVSGLARKEYSRIILARPAVEAGERLGYLPGDLYEKVLPYLRPLYDALYDMMDYERAQKLIERGTIEIAPLAFMRGRTLNDSFVILDEAQNTTSEQMKMFLTRLGFNSKAVITGDITQVDLPDGKPSGLIEARTLLGHISGLRFIYFTERDVVRHPLVQEIIRAYNGQKRSSGSVAG